MITIYHLGVSQSDRIVWLMEELGLPYQLEWFDRGEDMLATQAYRDLHPAATSPVVKDDERVMTESTAIVQYICDRYAGGQLTLKPEHPEYFNYLYWMQFNNNAQQSFFTRLAAGDNDNVGSTVANRRESALYKYLDQRLGEVEYLAGEFSAADIMSMFNLTALPLFGGRHIDDLPNVKAYVERISARPAYQKAMALAGPAATKPE